MPCDYSLYPRDWQEIRQRILERAGNRCEKCRIPHHAVGYRDEDGAFIPNGGNLHCDASGQGMDHDTGEQITYSKAKDFVDFYNDCHIDFGRSKNGRCSKRATDDDGNHWFVVVLTVAHMDEDGPMDCPDDRLRALCQKCHNQHDAPMRARHRRQTRRAVNPVPSLFEVTT